MDVKDKNTRSVSKKSLKQIQAETEEENDMSYAFFEGYCVFLIFTYIILYIPSFCNIFMLLLQSSEANMKVCQKIWYYEYSLSYFFFMIRESWWPSNTKIAFRYLLQKLCQIKCRLGTWFSTLPYTKSEKFCSSTGSYGNVNVSPPLYTGWVEGHSVELPVMYNVNSPPPKTWIWKH